MQPTENRTNKNNPINRTNFYTSTPSSSDAINFQRKSFGNDGYVYNYQPSSISQNNPSFYPERYLQDSYSMPNNYPPSSGKQGLSSKSSNLNTNITQINEKLQVYQTQMQQVIKKYNTILNIIEKHQLTITENRDAINAILKQKANEKKQPLILSETQINQFALKITEQDIFKTYISKHNKQIYQHIFNTKQELGILKEQLNEIKSIKVEQKDQKNNQSKFKLIGNLRSLEFSLLQMEQDARRTQETQKERKNPESDGSKQEHKEIQMHLIMQDVQKLIEKNKQDIETNLADAFANLQSNLISKLIEALNKPSLQQIKQQLRPGPLRSLISPIMVTIREQFVVINKNNKRQIKLEQEGIEQKNEENTSQIKKIPYKQNTYLVDKQGYLLDNEGKYLLTPQSRRVKLEPKHIQFLRKSNAMS